MKFNLKNCPDSEWKKGFEKILKRRRKQLEKWKPTTNRGQGIKDELLILINDLLGEDTRLLCLASLIPKEILGE